MSRSSQATPSLVKSIPETAARDDQDQQLAHEAKRKEHTKPSAKQKASLWLVLLLWTHLALICAVIWFAVQGSLNYSELNQRVEQKSKQIQDLTHTVQQLVQHIATNSSEDVLFLKILVIKPDVNRRLARKIARHVAHYATLYGKDPNLVLAIMAIESRFEPKSVSNKGALGLMQVMPQWSKVLGIQENLKDPETNIKYGMQILGFYQQMYKDLEMALTAYNRGPGPVDMALMRGKDFRNNYAAKVLAKYKMLKSMELSRP